MKLRDLLELCRVSNLPTVWSNAAVGVFAGASLFATNKAGELQTTELVISIIFVCVLCVAMSLIYCGGMVMNDYVDRKIDAAERPDRPIPSGRVKPGDARKAATLMIVGGVFVVLLSQVLFPSLCADFFPEASVVAVVLAGCVCLYNLTHHLGGFAILFMALCRALIVVCGMLMLGSCGELLKPGVDPTPLVGPAATLFVYTLMISAVARREMESKRFAGPKTIMNMIAAMPLLDAAWLIVMGLWPASLFCVACAGMTKLAHRKVAGS